MYSRPVASMVVTAGSDPNLIPLPLLMQVLLLMNFRVFVGFSIKVLFFKTVYSGMGTKKLQ